MRATMVGPDIERQISHSAFSSLATSTAVLVLAIQLSLAIVIGIYEDEVDNNITRGSAIKQYEVIPVNKCRQVLAQYTPKVTQIQISR